MGCSHGAVRRLSQLSTLNSQLPVLVTATWQIKLGTLVLLDWGELMDDEPRIERAQVNDIVPTLGASVKKIFTRDNVSHVLRFTRVKVFDDDVAARDFLLTHTAAIPSSLLNCTIKRGNYVSAATTTLANAVIDQSGFSARCEANRFIASYQLIGGALS